MSKPTKVLYAAAVLDEPQARALLARLKELLGD